MIIQIDVSVGELLDKISILKIKSYKIKDTAKLKHINYELDSLTNTALKLNVLDVELLEELSEINSSLWKIEDDLRELELKKDFSDTFIQLARKVYITNDKRFKIKSKINDKYGSLVTEQKSYKNYNIK
tara:strand:+ start:6265 stop:6651 length:387 start_codon:yes stop_codon:yes gene_type:complete